MENNITKEEIKKLIAVPGKVRGQVFVTDLEYVREKQGGTGIILLKNRMAEFDSPIDYDKIEISEWYPIGLRAVSLLVIKDVFGFSDNEIREMGNSAPKFSFVVKNLMKYFLSPEKGFKESPKYWPKHYTVGRLEDVEYSEEKKHYIYRLHDFKIHPIFCTYLMDDGYFLRIGQYSRKSQEMHSRETKCEFKGDPYHECIIEWK